MLGAPKYDFHAKFDQLYLLTQLFTPLARSIQYIYLSLH